MTFVNEKDQTAGAPAVAIRFPMPRRSIQIVCNEARYNWTVRLYNKDSDCSCPCIIHCP